MPNPAKKKPAKSPEPAEPKRMRVKPRKTIFWPAELVGRPDTDVRGTAGYIVDWTLSWERDWCKGHEYKLEPAPDDAVPDEVELKQALREIGKRQGLVEQAPKTVKAQKDENAEAAVDGMFSAPPVAPAPKKESGR